LNWDQEAFDEAFLEVSDQGMAKADFKAKLVWLPKAIQHNKPESPNVVRGWRVELDLLPECDLKREAIAGIRAALEGAGPSYVEAFDELQTGRQKESAKPSPKPSAKASQKTMANQEQEQEQEQEEDKSAGEPATPLDPEKQKSRSTTLAAYLDVCRAAGVKPIPEDHHIRRYCADAGIADEMTAIAWLRFREEHTTGARKAKRYVDWPETFANCVKSSWYGLWACNAEGPANWTTKGLQEKRVADARRAEKEASHEHA